MRPRHWTSIRRTARWLLAIAIASQPGSGTWADDAFLPRTTIVKGLTGALSDSAQFVIARNREEWSAAWRIPAINANGEIIREGWLHQPLPSVDFERAMVVGVVLATHSNGCTGVTITAARLEGEKVIVGYSELPPVNQPGSSRAICPATFTTAFHFVSIPRTDKSVVFEPDQASAVERER